MGDTPTPYQEALLEKLLNGSVEEQEMVISLQPLDRQPDFRRFINTRNESNALIDVLLQDLSQSGRMVKNDPSNQLLRRTAIRCFTAAVEGIIYCLKQTAHSSGEFAGHSFSEDEMFLLTENQNASRYGRKGRHLSFRDNFKQTFKLFAKIFQVSHKADFGNAGFKCLCDTFDLRDKLMHPKKLSAFEVSDEAKQCCAVAADWFHSEVLKLLNSCQSSPLGN